MDVDFGTRLRALPNEETMMIQTALHRAASIMTCCLPLHKPRQSNLKQQIRHIHISTPSDTIELDAREPLVSVKRDQKIQFLVGNPEILEDENILSLQSFYIDPNLEGKARCWDYLIQRSRKTTTAADGEITVELPDVDPRAFEMYIEWLESGLCSYYDIQEELRGEADHGQDSGLPTHSLTWVACRVHILAHILGGRLEDSTFRMHIEADLDRLLIPYQDPDVETLDLVFTAEWAKSHLKEFRRR